MGSENYRKILVATDGSDTAKNVVSSGIELAKAVGAKLYAMYVISSRFGSGKAVRDHFIEEGNEALAYVREAGKAADVEIESVMLEGVPSEEIVDFAEKNNIDLIVMGSLGKTGLSKLLLGSVAENVIRHSKKQVLIVR